jgi:ParB family chromosome partitioning protein
MNTEIMHPNIIIDPEFQALIPALQPEERTQLEANIVADGCRDPLVLWPCDAFEYTFDDGDTQTLFYSQRDTIGTYSEDEGQGTCTTWETEDGDTVFLEDWPHILVDGHNRHEICTRLGIGFETVSMEFNSRDDAVLWICKNQFGRRNLTDYQRGVLALRMKPIVEKQAKANLVASGENFGKGSPKSDEPIKPIRTDDVVAGLANIGRDTLRKIEKLEMAAEPEVKQLAAAGAVSINLATQFAELPQEVQQRAIASVLENSEPAKEVMREAVKAHVAQNSGNNEWYTPADYIALAREVMGGIDTDPASSEIANRTVQAAQYFTEADNGLLQQWAGRVWMNPPYAQPLIANFADAIASKYESGEIEQACILINNGTETQWFQRMLQAASAVCFPKSRVRFLDPVGNLGAPLQGQAVIYMGKNSAAFAEAFSPKGTVLFNV